jgi:hypothetical protein
LWPTPSSFCCTRINLYVDMFFMLRIRIAQYKNLSCISPTWLATCKYLTVSAWQIHMQPSLSTIFWVVCNEGISAMRVWVEQVYLCIELESSRSPILQKPFVN